MNSSYIPPLLMLPLMAAVVSNSEQLAPWLLADDEAPETHTQHNDLQPIDTSTPPQSSMLDQMRATIKIRLAEKARLCDRMTNLRLWQSSYMTASFRARRGLAPPYNCGASEASASAAIDLLSAQIQDMKTVIKMDQEVRAAKLREREALYLSRFESPRTTTPIHAPIYTSRTRTSPTTWRFSLPSNRSVRTIKPRSNESVSVAPPVEETFKPIESSNVNSVHIGSSWETAAPPLAPMLPITRDAPLATHTGLPLPQTDVWSKYRTPTSPTSPTVHTRFAISFVFDDGSTCSPKEPPVALHADEGINHITKSISRLRLVDPADVYQQNLDDIINNFPRVQLDDPGYPTIAQAIGAIPSHNSDEMEGVEMSAPLEDMGMDIDNKQPHPLLPVRAHNSAAGSSRHLPTFARSAQVVERAANTHGDVAAGPAVDMGPRTIRPLRRARIPPPPVAQSAHPSPNLPAPAPTPTPSTSSIPPLALTHHRPTVTQPLRSPFAPPRSTPTPPPSPPTLPQLAPTTSSLPSRPPPSVLPRTSTTDGRPSQPSNPLPSNVSLFLPSARRRTQRGNTVAGSASTNRTISGLRSRLAMAATTPVAVARITKSTGPSGSEG